MSKLKELNFLELTKVELIEINGGHDGESYQAGVAVGRFISKAATFFGIAALIFAPKS